MLKSIKRVKAMIVALAIGLFVLAEMMKRSLGQV